MPPHSACFAGMNRRGCCHAYARLLETQGDEKQFYVTRVSLFGSKEQDGSGAWNLQHDDKDGNSVNV
jgi:hypothetical protein